MTTSRKGLTEFSLSFRFVLKSMNKGKEAKMKAGALFFPERNFFQSVSILYVM